MMAEASLSDAFEELTTYRRRAKQRKPASNISLKSWNRVAYYQERVK